MSVDILTLSSKGQLVLPAKIRKSMSLRNGDKLVMYSTNDVIMLKPIQLPTEEEFKKQLDEAQQWASSVGYTEDDISRIIKESRSKTRRNHA
jgi:AbrB family looped-hinge helix DNA binding protein